MRTLFVILVFVGVVSADSPELAKKKVLIGSLKNKEFELKKTHNQAIPKLSKIEEFCLKEETSVEACRAKVDAAINKAQIKSQVLSNVKERGEALERFNEKRQKARPHPH
jgi:hypothetical protein